MSVATRSEVAPAPAGSLPPLPDRASVRRGLLIILATFVVGIGLRALVFTHGIEDDSFPPNYMDVKADAYRARVALETGLRQAYENTLPMTPEEAGPDFEGYRLNRVESAPYPVVSIFYLAALRAVGGGTMRGMFLAFMALELLFALLYAAYALRIGRPGIFPLYYLNCYFLVKAIQRPSTTALAFFVLWCGAFMLLTFGRRRLAMVLSALAIGCKFYPILLLARFHERGWALCAGLTATLLLLPFVLLPGHLTIYTFHAVRGDPYTKALSILFALTALAEIAWLSRQPWCRLEDLFPFFPLPFLAYSALPTGGFHLFPLMLMLPDRTGLRNRYAFGLGLLMPVIYWFHLGLHEVVCNPKAYRIGGVCYDGPTRYVLVIISCVVTLTVIPVIIRRARRQAAPALVGAAARGL